MHICLCGKKGEYKVEHGFLCRACYTKHIEEKFFRFVTRNKLIIPERKYIFISDSFASKAEEIFLDKFFKKYKLERFKKIKASSLDLKALALKYPGYRVILPNTVDLDAILGLKALVEFKDFNFLPLIKIGKTEFVKPFNSLKDEELEQYSRIKRIPLVGSKQRYKNFEPYSSMMERLDEKYFVKRSFLHSMYNLSKQE